LGDPYRDQCEATALGVAEQLVLNEGQLQVVFQSRFGKEEWLQPYTDKTLENLPKEGIDHVDILCPGFSADCVETLEEIAIQNQELFIDAGGEALNYIPALNSREDHIEALTEIILERW
jgi:ferrochelatase